MMHMKSEAPRRYVQTRRAAAAAETAAKIMDAARTLFLQSGELSALDEVAARAGVSVQTVLRRFGSKEGLFRAAVAQSQAEVGAARGAVTPGDVDGAVDNLLEHYEALGAVALRLLALADRTPAAAEVVAGGKALHRRWVDHAFGPQLADVAPDDRRVLAAQLVAVTDVTVWSTLREQGLDAADLRRAVHGLVAGLIGRSP
jgi:AcrR family transcriptional regulator